MAEETPKAFPIHPVNGRVLLRALPFKPSSLIQLVDDDKANETESIVVALAPYKLGYRKKKGIVEVLPDVRLEWDIKVGDRVIHEGCYQEDDKFSVNGEKYRVMDPWQIKAIIDRPQPEGYVLPDGSKSPENHPLLTL